MGSNGFEKAKRRMCLIQETENAINCVIKGLGDLQKIDAVNTFYYAPLIFLSNGYEKLLKCILCFINLNEEGIVAKIPFEKKGRQGHNIVTLFEILIEELKNRDYESKSFYTKVDMEFLVNNRELEKIIGLLSEFAQGGRYYYLDVILDGKSSFKDPEKTWEMLETEILKKDKKLFEAWFNGTTALNEVYSIITPTFIKTLERFTVALSRIFAHGKFNKEMRVMVNQLMFFITLDDEDLGKTNYREQTWDTLGKKKKS